MALCCPSSRDPILDTRIKLPYAIAWITCPFRPDESVPGSSPVSGRSQQGCLLHPRDDFYRLACEIHLAIATKELVRARVTRVVG